MTRQLLDTVRRVQHTVSADERTRLASLTPREGEVLVLLAQGMSNADIAKHLFASESTVKMHVSRILAKLAVENRVQAALLARNANLGQD